MRERKVVGPVGFEPTTSAESFVYGYLHALLNFVIPPTGGLLTRCSIFWSPSSFLSRTLCQKSWNADNSRDSTVIIPLYVVPHMWAYSATISTSLDRFFLNCSQPAVAFFLSASVKGLTR